MDLKKFNRLSSWEQAACLSHMTYDEIEALAVEAEEASDKSFPIFEEKMRHLRHRLRFAEGKKKKA